MSGYTKLFHDILGSTIWREDLSVKICCVTLLALADREGIVSASVPGLAHFAGVSVEQAEIALEKFLSPDPYSRSPEHEGRRIEPIDGGWRLLNYSKYRFKMSAEDIRERDRVRQQRYRRERKACHTESVTECDTRNESRQSRQSIKQKAKSKKQKAADSPLLGETETVERAGAELLQKLSEPLSDSLLDIVCQVLKILGKLYGKTPAEAAEHVYAHRRRHGQNAPLRFWLEDGKWKQPLSP